MSTEKTKVDQGTEHPQRSVITEKDIKEFIKNKGHTPAGFTETVPTAPQNLISADDIKNFINNKNLNNENNYSKRSV